MTTLPPAKRHSFPPSARLHASAEYQAVFKGAKRLSSSHLRLHAHVRAEATAPRLGVTVSKKVDKRAVGRNRIKRIAREFFRHEKALLPPGDYVLLVQPGAKLLSNEEIRQQLRPLFERARSLMPTPPPGTMTPSRGVSEHPASDS